MTTEIEERTELVKPDQDSGSPASNGSSADPLPVQDRKPERIQNILPEQSTFSPEKDPLSPQISGPERREDPEQNPPHDPLSIQVSDPVDPVRNPNKDPLALPGGRRPGPEPDRVRYRKGCDGEYEACYRLRQDGWIVSRWQGYPSPPDLIAVRTDEILLVMVRRSKQPVPDAHAVFLRYRDGLACLRDIGSPAVVRKEAWIFCPPDGCHCYEVLPGGIRRIRREWGRKESSEPLSVEVPFPRNIPKTGEETPSVEVPFPRNIPKTGEETPSVEVPFPRNIPKTGEEKPSTEMPFYQSVPKTGKETPPVELQSVPGTARGEAG